MKLIHIHGVWPLYTNTFLLITAAGHAVVVEIGRASCRERV